MAARENIGQDDHVGFMVDTFNNQRSAFAFYSNSRGIQLDMRWAEGEGAQVLTQHLMRCGSARVNSQMKDIWF